MRPLRLKLASRRKQRGEAIVEGMISMLLLCLVLFGLLQVFYLTVAQMLVQYSAFTAARASSVGIADYLVDRFSRTAVAGASGSILTPPSSFSSMVSQAGSETLATYSSSSDPDAWGFFPRYHAGVSWLEYEFWAGKNKTQILTGSLEGSGGGSWSVDVPDAGTTFGCLVQRDSELVSSTVGFNKYPTNFPMWKAFSSEDSLDISYSTSIQNYAYEYLEE